MPFRNITGHRRLVELLSHAIDRGTLPPSLIFAGPQDDGTREVATAVAQALNCLTPYSESHGSVDACGTCAACLRIARGVHPDVLVVEPGDSGSIKIEQVRDVIDRAGYRPFEGRRRVVIIAEADALVPPAQNALLKTLEEPPSSSVFILATERPDLLLATVRSRCIRLPFARLSRPVVDVEAREVAGRVLARAAAARNPSARLQGAQELLAKTGSGGAGDREQLAAHLRAVASLLRDLELLGSGADADRLDNADWRSALDELQPAYADGRAARAFAAVGRAVAALDQNAGVKIVADWVALQL